MLFFFSRTKHDFLFCVNVSTSKSRERVWWDRIWIEIACNAFCGHTRDLDALTCDMNDRLSSVTTISTTHMLGKLFFFDCVLQFTHMSPPKSPHPVLAHLKLLSTLMMYLYLMMKTMMDWKYTVVTCVFLEELMYLNFRCSQTSHWWKQVKSKKMRKKVWKDGLQTCKKV